MIMDNGKYRLSLPVHEWLCEQPVPAPVLRAFHALLHHQWVRHEWKPAFLDAPEHAASWSRCIDLRRRAGLEGRRDNRTLQQMIAHFGHETIFDHIALSDCRAFLEWQFASTFHADMYHMPRYALLDIAQVAACRTREELVIYSHTARTWQMRRPSFTLSPQVVHGWRAGDWIDWPRVKRGMLKGFSRVAAMAGARFLVILVEDGPVPGVSRLEVRYTHSLRHWPSGTQYRGLPHAAMYLVGPDDCRRLNRAEILARAADYRPQKPRKAFPFPGQNPPPHLAM